MCIRDVSPYRTWCRFELWHVLMQYQLSITRFSGFNIQYDSKTMKPMTRSPDRDRVSKETLQTRGKLQCETLRETLIKDIGDRHGVKCWTKPNYQQVRGYRRHQNESQSAFSYNTKNGWVDRRAMGKVLKTYRSSTAIMPSHYMSLCLIQVYTEKRLR